MIKLIVPAIAPSINCGYAGKTRRYATKALKDYKKYVNIYVQSKLKTPSWSVDCRLELEINIAKNWMTKSGLPRSAALSNLWKFSEDAFMEALGIDDKWVFKTISSKIISTQKEYTEYILRPMK